MDRSVAQPEAPSFSRQSGNLLLVLVGLGVMFFLVNALFPVMKGAALVTEWTEAVRRRGGRQL